MKRLFGLIAMTVVLTPALGVGAPKYCGPQEKAVIDGQAKCVASGGIDIGFLGEDGIKVACMEDKRVVRECGPDGRITRLQAYRSWYNNLQQFQASCASRGGTPKFEDPSFTEPTDESFCLQAQPTVGSNMFESALCNYQAICPSITMTCDFSCKKESIAAYNDTDAVPAREDAGLLKRLTSRPSTSQQTY
jgi:hypothetical protein